MTRPSVLHISSVHQLDDVRIAGKECQSLAARSFQVAFAAQGDGPTYFHNGVLHIPVGRPPTRWARFTRIIPSLIRVIHKMRPDIVHLHDPELVPLGLFLRFVGFRVIYDVHEDVRRQVMDKQWLPRWVRRAIAVVMRCLEWGAGRAMSGVVVSTPQIAGHFPASRTYLVRNFPRIEELAGAYRPYSLRPEATVLYLGSISEARGLAQMIEVAHRIHAQIGARVILAGPAGSPAVAQLIRANCGPSLDWLGVVSREGVGRLLSDARVGLMVLQSLPRYQESIPLKMFEYMIAGVPIVASDFPAWRALASTSGACIWIDPSDVDAIVRAVVQLLEAPDAAGARGLSGRDLVLSQYTWESEAEVLTGLYEKLLGVGGTGA